MNLLAHTPPDPLGRPDLVDAADLDPRVHADVDPGVRADPLFQDPFGRPEQDPLARPLTPERPPMLYVDGEYICDVHLLDRLANNKRRRRALPRPQPAPERTLKGPLDYITDEYRALVAGYDDDQGEDDQGECDIDEDDEEALS
jgi:hypothetical protein